MSQYDTQNDTQFDITAYPFANRGYPVKVIISKDGQPLIEYSLPQKGWQHYGRLKNGSEYGLLDVARLNGIENIRSLDGIDVDTDVNNLGDLMRSLVENPDDVTVRFDRSYVAKHTTPSIDL